MTTIMKKAARGMAPPAAFECDASNPKNSKLFALVEYLPEAPPVAYATATRGRECWGLTIAFCPFCGRVHRHGGGDGPAPVFGHRVAHCGTGGMVASYVLLPAPGGVQ